MATRLLTASQNIRHMLALKGTPIANCPNGNLLPLVATPASINSVGKLTCVSMNAMHTQG